MEENKAYSIIGQVTIGTDEYRDLITEKFEAIKEKEEASSRASKYYWENKELEEKNKKFEEELAMLKRYIKETAEQDKYELWLLKITRED